MLKVGKRYKRQFYHKLGSVRGQSVAALFGHLCGRPSGSRGMIIMIDITHIDITR